ncbi:MAG: hypothetical protein WBN04_19910 [Paracoccaceae bacterium]
MARASQDDPAQQTRKDKTPPQADQAKSGSGPQRQAGEDYGDDQYGSAQQGGSDTPTRFNDWASI